MGYLSHPYAWRLRSATFAGATIERLQYRDTLDVVIRFADWRGRRFNPKALEIGENELLVLIGEAVAAGVFSPRFVYEARDILEAKARMTDRPIAVPADRALVEEMRRLLDASPDSGFEIIEGGIDDEGQAFVKLRKKPNAHRT